MSGNRGCPPGGWPKKGRDKPMKLSKDLDHIVGANGEKMSRAMVLKGLWAYIKKHNLQKTDNKRMFTPDVAMAKVFGKGEIHGLGMAKYLKEHIWDEGKE